MAAQKCSGGGVDLLDPSRLPDEKRCPRCGEIKPAAEFRQRRRKNQSGSVSLLLFAWCKPCERKDGRDRKAIVPRESLAATMRKYRASDPRPRMVDRWRESLRRGSDITLEEYAEHYERSRMGCKPADWGAWVPDAPKAAKATTQEDQAREAASRLQRPVIGPKGKRAWPSGWTAAERFAWRYKNDVEFREKQIMRTKLRKYTMPSYGAASGCSVWEKRKWQRAASQMGKVTQPHLRRELRARLCSYCLEPLSADNRHLDHVQPLADGGLHDDSNIIACCSPCNRSKGRKSLIQWISQIPAARRGSFHGEKRARE